MQEGEHEWLHWGTISGNAIEACTRCRAIRQVHGRVWKDDKIYSYSYDGGFTWGDRVARTDEPRCKGDRTKTSEQLFDKI